MNLQENIQRIKQMMGLNEIANPYSITWLEPTREYFIQVLYLGCKSKIYEKQNKN